jgi:hypothetical protein
VTIRAWHPSGNIDVLRPFHQVGEQMTVRLLGIFGGLCLLSPGICATPNFHFEVLSAALLAIVGLSLIRLKISPPALR